MQRITIPYHDGHATNRKKGPWPNRTASGAGTATTEAPIGNQDRTTSKAVEPIAIEAPKGNLRSKIDQGPEANEVP